MRCIPLIINHYKDMHFLFSSIHNKTKNPPEYQNPHLKKNSVMVEMKD